MGVRCGHSPVVYEPMSATFSFPWEREAMRGDEMPDGLPLPDQMAYTAIRNVYDAFHKKILSRDMAAAEKRRIRREYEQAQGAWEFWDKVAKHHVMILKNTEPAKIACRKDPTPENALWLCDVLDGLCREEIP